MMNPRMMPTHMNPAYMNMAGGMQPGIRPPMHMSPAMMSGMTP